MGVAGPADPISREVAARDLGAGLWSVAARVARCPGGRVPAMAVLGQMGLRQVGRVGVGWGLKSKRN